MDFQMYFRRSKMAKLSAIHHGITRRQLLGAANRGWLGALKAGLAQQVIELPLPGGPSGEIDHDRLSAERADDPAADPSTAPGNAFEVFDKGVFTPNDQFYVRLALGGHPDRYRLSASFNLTVRGHVNQTLSLSLSDIVQGLPSVQFSAVNQCSGNSRGFFEPRVPGGEWANGAMGNAIWTGFPLKDVLDRSGVKPGAVQVRFRGLDEPVVAEAPLS